MDSKEGAVNPIEEMLKFWQNWIRTGMEAMNRIVALMASGTPPPLAWTTVLSEEAGRAVQMFMEGTKLAGFPDFKRMSEEVSLLRAQMEAMRTGMSAMQAAFQAQQQGWRALETMVQQIAAVQEEARRAVDTWTAGWEEQLGVMTRGLEEVRQHWGEMLRQGIAVSQASQKGVEELTRTVWELARKVTGGEAGIGPSIV